MKRFSEISTIPEIVDLDADGLDAVDDFNDGRIGFQTLKDLIGSEAASAVRGTVKGYDPESLFDDPESF